MNWRTKFNLLLAYSFWLCWRMPPATGSVYPNYYGNLVQWSWFQDAMAAAQEQQSGHLKWWQTAAFYQIYPRSFKDSNGDGIGDLNGITEQLPYLHEIGINATWLSPIFSSPMADFGYDIANFTEIDKIFGTIGDLERLITRAKQLGIRVILDFVPNHTSDECEWFRRSAASEPEYKDYYVWHPGRVAADGTRQPPTNWLSVFRGSAWQWHDDRQEYYLHQFLNKQPDLNYRNPRVREAMNSVLNFWLEKGVAGFRVDAVPHLFEVAPDAHGNFPDEPRNDWNNNDPADYGYLKHIYTFDQPETIALLYEWRSVLERYQREHGGEERVLLTEAWSPLDVVMKYYGNETAEGAQIPFNFQLIDRLTNDSNAYNYADAVNSWLDAMPAGRTANWVLGNHDKNRVGSRLGAARIDMLNILSLTLPGCSVTYQGEEIGMLDADISWQDTEDPQACRTNPDVYKSVSRDPERTPFQWSAERNAGFSAANRTWLPINDNYVTVNVAAERAQPLSHLRIFQQLTQLRQRSTYQFGQAEVKALNAAVLAVRRYLLNDYTYLSLLNIGDNHEYLNLKQSFAELTDELEYALVTDRSSVHLGERVQATNVTLAPNEAVVLRTRRQLTAQDAQQAQQEGYYAYSSAARVNLPFLLIICSCYLLSLAR